MYGMNKTFAELKIGDTFKTNPYENFIWVKISDTKAKIVDGKFEASMPLPNAEVITISSTRSDW